MRIPRRRAQGRPQAGRFHRRKGAGPSRWFGNKLSRLIGPEYGDPRSGGEGGRGSTQACRLATDDPPVGQALDDEVPEPGPERPDRAGSGRIRSRLGAATHQRGRTHPVAIVGEGRATAGCCRSGQQLLDGTDVVVFDRLVPRSRRRQATRSTSGGNREGNGRNRAPTPAAAARPRPRST